MKYCRNKSANARRAAKAKDRQRHIHTARLHVVRSGPTLAVKEAASGSIGQWLQGLWAAVARS